MQDTGSLAAHVRPDEIAVALVAERCRAAACLRRQRPTAPVRIALEVALAHVAGFVVKP